jgi:hypothetical protein
MTAEESRVSDYLGKACDQVADSLDHYQRVALLPLDRQIGAADEFFHYWKSLYATWQGTTSPNSLKPVYAQLGRALDILNGVVDDCKKALEQKNTARYRSALVRVKDVTPELDETRELLSKWLKSKSAPQSALPSSGAKD